MLAAHWPMCNFASEAPSLLLKSFNALFTYHTVVEPASKNPPVKGGGPAKCISCLQYTTSITLLSRLIHWMSYMMSYVSTDALTAATDKHPTNHQKTTHYHSGSRRALSMG